MDSQKSFFKTCLNPLPLLPRWLSANVPRIRASAAALSLATAVACAADAWAGGAAAGGGPTGGHAANFWGKTRGKNSTAALAAAGVATGGLSPPCWRPVATSLLEAVFAEDAASNAGECCGVAGSTAEAATGSETGYATGSHDAWRFRRSLCLQARHPITFALVTSDVVRLRLAAKSLERRSREGGFPQTQDEVQMKFI